jgi:exodeoxyribonuclease VII large subunit
MPETKPDIFTITEINRHIRNVVESNIPGMFVEGEVSNFTIHSSGHMYFSLKDEKSTLRCVFFKSHNLYLNFKPKNGDKVVCSGKISVYEKGGSYQLNITRMMPSGIGELQLKFEALKEKLEHEGLFDAEHKKELPEFPESIGVVTSATGAAIQDIRNVLSRRYPVNIYLFPATVQGDAAPPQIIKGIDYFNQEFSVDLIIIGRGGGSQEDLFCFNDEELARTIFASKIPIISAVGHEIDFTISDFVADLLAPTPSAAAELAVPDRLDIQGQINGYLNSMKYATQEYFFSRKMELQELESTINAHHPQKILENMHSRLNNAVLKMSYNVNKKIVSSRSNLDILSNELRELSPQAALKRGYSFIIQNKKLLHSIENVKKGDKLEVVLSDGKLKTEIMEIEN